MAFCFEIKSISKTLNGEEVYLCIGGVRSYHEENLYSRKSPEKFKIFIGYRVKVCSNLMLTCDGLKEKLEAMSDLDIYQSAIKLFTSFESEVNLRLLENLGRTRLTIQQYCQLIGRLRLYQVLPLSEQKNYHKKKIYTEEGITEKRWYPLFVFKSRMCSNYSVRLF